MSVDLSKITGLSDSKGVITQITDASGRVIWAVKSAEVIEGTLTLRPSADISVEHFLYPATSDVPAYQRINEEVSDGTSLYIGCNAVNDIETPTSKFKLSNTSQFSGRFLAITGVSIEGTPTGEGKNEFRLEINGMETEPILHEDTKDFSIYVPDAIDLLNEYVATHGVLPEINIIITSHVVTSNKGASDSGVTQVYVELSYEGC